MPEFFVSRYTGYCDCGAESVTWFSTPDGDHVCSACFKPCEKCGEHVAESADDRVDLHSGCVRAFLGTEPCPRCGKAPTVSLAVYGRSVACGNCYDGAPDAGPQLIGFAETEAAAIEAWNEIVEENRP